MSETTAPLTKIDSAVQGIDDHAAHKEPSHRRKSSSATGVFSIADLESENHKLEIAKETQKTNWRINKSPTTVDDKDILKKMLTTPPVKRVDLHFPLGLEVTARNLKGVTIKDAFDAIYKQFRKKADDELENPVLTGFEFDESEHPWKLIVHCQREGVAVSSKKSKKKEKDGDQ